MPPADMPEDRLFLLLQRMRRCLVTWLDTQSNSCVNEVLRCMLHVALRGSSHESVSDWQHDGAGTGRYFAQDTELQVDIQGAEVIPSDDDRYHYALTLIGGDTARRCTSLRTS